jgi:hypothetical protein
VSASRVRRVRPCAASAVLLVLALAGGCADQGGPVTGAPVQPVPVSFANDVQSIFTASCVAASCHGTPRPPTNPDLRAGSSWAALVNVTSAGYPPDLRVEPGHPERSVLYLKISGTSRGARMPFGLAPLDSAQVVTIRRWIAEGALEN